MIERADLVQPGLSESAEWRSVVALADRLTAALRSERVEERIAEVNIPRASSAEVQAAFLEEARSLGFRDEKTGLFAGYESALRPDYHLELDGTGIILEVERGKTTINNMDLLDFWKCHICEHADYLFLLVPRELRQNDSMRPRREFSTVLRRLATFFEPGNLTNVRGLVLIGY